MLFVNTCTLNIQGHSAHKYWTQPEKILNPNSEGQLLETFCHFSPVLNQNFKCFEGYLGVNIANYNIVSVLF